MTYFLIDVIHFNRPLAKSQTVLFKRSVTLQQVGNLFYQKPCDHVLTNGYTIMYILDVLKFIYLIDRHGAVNIGVL